MAVVKLLNLLAISCLAVIASLGPAPVGAVSVENVHHARHNLHHAVVAKKKRATSSKRCKPRATGPAPSKPTTSAPKPTHGSNSGSGSGSGGNSGSNNNNGGNSGNNNNNGGGGGASKAGIAWANGGEKSIVNFKTWKTDKYYTWSPWCSDSANKVGLKCCPMLWGEKQIDDFTKLVKPGYANCALGPNEPNQPGQSDMSPGRAVDLWWKYMNHLKDQGYYLVSPACTSAPSGKKWMQEFLGDCNGCQVDALAVHWYGTKADDMIAYLKDFYETFKKPIWVTEFACQNFSGGDQCSKDQVFDFMKKVTAWMDETWYIQEYFAFGILHDMNNVNYANQLMNGDGYPTALGKLYIGQ